MRELLSVHIGQCGIGIGSAMWSTFTHEQGLNEDGHPEFDSNYYKRTQELTADGKGPSADAQCAIDEASVVFELHGAYSHVPRAVFVDTDESEINQSKSSPPPTSLLRGFVLPATNRSLGRRN